MTESFQPCLEALMVHAGQAMRSGRPREAVRLIEEAEANLGAGADAALRGVLRRNLGIALAAAGELEAGIARLREALAADRSPNSPISTSPASCLQKANDSRPPDRASGL